MANNSQYQLPIQVRPIVVYKYMKDSVIVSANLHRLWLGIYVFTALCICVDTDVAATVAVTLHVLHQPVYVDVGRSNT